MHRPLRCSWRAPVLALLLASLAGRADAEEREVRDEGLCDLKGLYVTEQSFFQETHRYSANFGRMGFAPLPCLDGTRPATENPSQLPGCQFVYSVELDDPEGRSGFTAIAKGVSASARGLEFRIDTLGRISGADATLQGLDCEQNMRRRDPLWRWREQNIERDCCTRQEADPLCREALGVLMDAHRRGLGIAREPYDQCPAAQGLDTRAPLEDRLCAPGPSLSERLPLAQALAKRGTLMSTLARAECVPAAYAASVDVLADDFAHHCQGQECILVLGRMRDAVPGPRLERLLATYRDQMFPLVKREVEKAPSPRALAPLLSQLLGVAETLGFELAVLLRGEVHPGLERMSGGVLRLPPEPLTLQLLQLAREREEPGASGVAGLVLEMHGRGELLAGQFTDTMERVPCTFFNQASLFIQGRPSRAEAISREAGRRCRNAAQSLWPALAHLPPAELEKSVAALGCDRLPWDSVHDPLGVQGGFLEQHFGWLGRLCPREAWSMLTASRTPLNPELAEHALKPEQLRRFRFVGSPDLMLRTLNEAWHSNRGATPAVFLVLARAMGRELTGELIGSEEQVRALAFERISANELREAVAPLLAHPRPRIRAATAALLAELGVEIPREPALACAEEHEARVSCLEGAIHAVGPRPGTASPLRIVPPGSDPFYGAGPPNDRYWCALLESRVEACRLARWNTWDTVCGGAPLKGEALTRLAVAAGRPLSEVPRPPDHCARWRARLW